MKYLSAVVTAILIFHAAHAQITITSADMPVAGDMLSYSNAPTTINFSPADSGQGISWNYDLSSDSMGVDTYKTAYQVNPVYAGTISLSAFGYKVADSIPGLSMLTAITMVPITVDNIYNFFQEITTPRAAFMASSYAYTLDGLLPSASNYTDPDVWYFFPMAYGNATDSNHYELDLSLMSLFTIKEIGYRKIRVDGWGTITTPYFTTPVNCIRVRTEIHEIDSISYSTFTFGVPRNSVEYKWLVNGEHYPALWITSNVIGGTENVTQVRYRDAMPTTKVTTARPAILDIAAYPNPATNGNVTLTIPSGWKNYSVEVFDINSKEVAAFNNRNTINMQSMPSGNYLVRVTSGSNVGYTKLVKQ